MIKLFSTIRQQSSWPHSSMYEAMKGTPGILPAGSEGQWRPHPVEGPHDRTMHNQLHYLTTYSATQVVRQQSGDARSKCTLSYAIMVCRCYRSPEPCHCSASPENYRLKNRTARGHRDVLGEGCDWMLVLGLRCSFRISQRCSQFQLAYSCTERALIRKYLLAPQASPFSSHRPRNHDRSCRLRCSPGRLLDNWTRSATAALRQRIGAAR